MPGPRERTSSVGPSILATRPRSLRRSFVFYVRSLLHNTHRRGHSKSITTISKCISKSASVDGAHKSFSTFRQEPRGARPSPTPREGTSRNARTTSYNRTTDHTHSHTTRGRGGRGRGTRGRPGARAGGRPRTGALSGALPYSRAVTQAPSLRNATTPLSGLRAPRRGPRRGRVSSHQRTKVYTGVDIMT